MARPTRYKNPRSISLRIEADVLADIDELANKLSIDRSQVINAILKKYRKKNPFATGNDSVNS